MTIDYNEPQSSVYNNLHVLRALSAQCTVPPCTQSSFLEPLRLHDSLALFLSTAERDTTAVTTRMTTRGLVIFVAKSTPPSLAHREAGELLRQAILHPDANESSLMSAVLSVCGVKIASCLRRITTGISWDAFAENVDLYSQASAATGRTAVTKNVGRLWLKYTAPDLFESLKTRYRTILTKALALQLRSDAPKGETQADSEAFLLLSTLASVLADSTEGMILCEQIPPEERKGLSRLRRDLLDIVRYRTAVLNVLNRVRMLGSFADRLNVHLDWVSNDPTNPSRYVGHPSHLSAYETVQRRAERLGRGNITQTKNEFYSRVKEPKQPTTTSALRVHPAIILLLYMDQRATCQNPGKLPPKLQTIGCSERCSWETALWISCYNSARDKQWSTYGSRQSPRQGRGGWWKFPLAGVDVDFAFAQSVERELDEHLLGRGLMGPMSG